jgi:hypothetical protein
LVALAKVAARVPGNGGFLAFGYFVAGAMAAASIHRDHASLPETRATSNPSAISESIPAEAAPILKENYTGPTFPIPPLHFDPAHAILPDPKMTPGDTLPGVTAEDVCTPGWSREHRHVTEDMRSKVYTAYGRTRGPGCCEVDHLIPLELGGSNDIKNLWPQPDDPRPGDGEKDQLENDLHARVCNGSMSLADAQRCIATDWVKCWETYVVPEYGSEWAKANRHGW